ncbi:MAG: L,D-transpeptidase family protein [Selenomonadaceae bacterium]|nr:L,D-transpeptidase family protein [Selenomonadaceae bacterium]
MSKLLIFAAMLLTLIVGSNFAAAQSTTPQWIQNLPAAQNVNQIFVVAQIGEKTTAWISMHQKDANGEWQQIMTTPGFLGKEGLGKTKEGDAKTPVGVFRFNRAMGIADDPGCAIPYLKVDENHYWSGDTNYKYNQLVDIGEYPNLNKEDSEHIIDYNPHYTYALNISYNESGTPGLGSAIFLHCFGPIKPWTGGCVAIPTEKMKFVMQNVQPECVVVIDTLENLGGTI